MKILQKTQSLCPHCFRTIKAYYAQRENGVFFEKNCPEHGDFSVPAWIDMPKTPSFESWCASPPATKILTHIKGSNSSRKGCPHDCGLCQDHAQQSCCVLLEVTQRCNMHCPICYASAGKEEKTSDMRLDVIQERLKRLMQRAGAVNIQLSGGEPTLHENLEDIIRLTHAQGFSFVQLNTNGLRLGQEPSYAKKLKDAGLNLVYLQWDSMEDTAYTTLRGAAYAQCKEKALQHCIETQLPVLLVITLVRGVNDTALGAILHKALQSGPLVRGIHIQPVASFGRYPWEQIAAPRFTLPEILHALEAQSHGMLQAQDFHPPSSEHALCSFSAVYQREEKKHDTHAGKYNHTLRPVHEQKGCCNCTQEAAHVPAAVQARTFVAHHWGAAQSPQGIHEQMTQDGLDTFIQKNTVQNRFTISAMAFQDAYSLDLARLRRCHIHIAAQEGNIIPFCAYNMTSSANYALYRGKEC